jgi:DNA-binding transcriptional LysR family regulator
MLHARMLRYLDAVARLGTIRKAAAQLNVASSAINRQIIALEQHIGEPLFERMPRRMRLTATGELLIVHVRQTLKAHEATMRQIAAMRGHQMGSVTIATSLGLAAGPMASIIDEYRDANPGMRVRVSGGVTEAIAAQVTSGEAHLGLAYGLGARPGLRSLFACDLPLGALMAGDHELAGRASLKLRDILAYPLVLAEPGMSLRTATDIALSRFDDNTEPALETNSVELMRNYVARTQAIAIINPLDVIEDTASGRLAFVRIDDENLHPQTLRLTCRSRDALDSSASHFSQALMSRLSELADELAIVVDVECE